MRIPLVWLKEYVKTDKTPKEIGESFTLLGLLLDSIEEDPRLGPVLNLEHRMDRSDWLSVLGCARDLAAFEKLDLNYPESFVSEGKAPTEQSRVRIEVQCEDLVNRFNTRVFRNITVKESPDWLKNRLEAYGIPSINNIVDVTNYVMVEYGQPMHAQDMDKMEKPEIVIRRAHEGEKITTLLGETIELDNDTFVLTQNGKPSVIGGVVGGVSTGVDLNTKNIVLDAGNYNQTNVRKTSRRLKIQNETVQRYDKFLHPELTQIAIERAVHLILQLAGGEYYQNEDWYPEKWGFKEMTLRLERVNLISGIDFGLEKVREILQALEYKLIEINQNEGSIKLEVPYFRTDIDVEDDLVADVLRINGYNKLPLLPIQTAPPEDITPEVVRFEEQLRDELVKLKLHEHITDPLVAANEQHSNQVMLLNALSSDKNALRTSLYETLKSVALTYRKHRIEEFGLFEIGKKYSKSGKGSEHSEYLEKRETVIYYFNLRYSPEEVNRHLSSILSGLMKNLGINNLLYAREGKTVIISQNTLLLAEIDYDHVTLYNENLLKAEKTLRRIRHKVPNVIFEDLSIVLEKNQPFGPIFSLIQNTEVKPDNITVIEEFTDDKKLGAGKKAILVRLDFDGNSLNYKQISESKKNIIQNIKNEFNVSIRS